MITRNIKSTARLNLKFIIDHSRETVVNALLGAVANTVEEIAHLKMKGFAAIDFDMRTQTITFQVEAYRADIGLDDSNEDFAKDSILDLLEKRMR